MIIACLGWGSLVWSPHDLPIRGVWQLDGPFLPIEFSRVSSDGRVTLAITPRAPGIRSLWVQLTCESLEESVRALARREGIDQRDDHPPKAIGYWSKANGHSQHEAVAAVEPFALSTGLDAVVWTELKPGISKCSRGKAPTEQEIEHHLRGLPSYKLAMAEAYVRNAPAPIDTTNRRFLESRFGWHPSHLAYAACGLTRRCS